MSFAMDPDEVVSELQELYYDALRVLDAFNRLGDSTMAKPGMRSMRNDAGGELKDALRDVRWGISGMLEAIQEAEEEWQAYLHDPDYHD